MGDKMFLKILAILVALVIVGSGIVVGAGPVNNASNRSSSEKVSYPINMDAIEEVYPLDSAAKEKLLKNGFVVLKDYEYDSISGCYFSLIYEYNVSVFVTSDAMLHVFHVMHDGMLQDIEREYLYNSTELLVQDMQKESMSQYRNISSSLPYAKEAVRRNVVFFIVACKLLNDTYPVPSYAEDNVTEYVQKILNHSVVEFYPGDDYTQYEPRGHYEGDPMLEKYFRCTKWLGRRIFRIEDKYYPEDSHIEMIQAVMISGMLRESSSDMELWEKGYNITTLLVGTADSITPIMVQQAVANVFGENFTISMLEDSANIEKLREEFKKPEYPESQIIPVPLEYPDQIPPKYIQFMGERYVPDSYVFQQVTYPHVSTRPLPKGLDIMTTMLGSNRAAQLLEEEKKIYPELESQYDKLRGEFENYTIEDWQKNVYCNWFYTLEPLLEEFNQSYPLFMQNTAWQDEKLNTALSSWTQLRHDYILYAKPPYPLALILDGYGYVEPVPDFYYRLASLCRKIDTELLQEGVDIEAEGDFGSFTYHNHLTCLANTLDTLDAYARKELNNESLTNDEQEYIHSFWAVLEWLLLPWCEEEIIKPMLVADVCTDSVTGRVLHEGVGKFNPIIVVYEEPDGTSRAGIGYVMSYYEFTEENFTRITDSEWKKWVENGTLPPRPFWANSFLYPVAITQFDTGHGTYPSIMGNHTGTIKPNHTVIATTLYTYPCEGTGGHTEYAEIRNATWNATATGEGYVNDWHNITFDKTVVLLANETYSYTIRTGSYPQIHHTDALPTANGWINCTKFTDANGKEYTDWIPAIRLW